MGEILCTLSHLLHINCQYWDKPARQYISKDRSCNSCSIELDPSSRQPFDDSYENGLFTVHQVRGQCPLSVLILSGNIDLAFIRIKAGKMGGQGGGQSTWGPDWLGGPKILIKHLVIVLHCPGAQPWLSPALIGIILSYHWACVCTADYSRC